MYAGSTNRQPHRTLHILIVLIVIVLLIFHTWYRYSMVIRQILVPSVRRMPYSTVPVEHHTVYHTIYSMVIRQILVPPVRRMPYSSTTSRTPHGLPYNSAQWWWYPRLIAVLWWCDAADDDGDSDDEGDDDDDGDGWWLIDRVSHGSRYPPLPHCHNVETYDVCMYAYHQHSLWKHLEETSSTWRKWT